jgi:hypothetical protein
MIISRLYETNSHKEGDYYKNFYICSKDNPVRVLDCNGKSTQTYIIKNHLEEVISPITIKLDTFVKRFLNIL